MVHVDISVQICDNRIANNFFYIFISLFLYTF